MHKTTTKHKLRSLEHGLYNDLDKIKDAIAGATYHAKDRAGQMLTDSYENIKSKSYDLQDNAALYVADKPFKSLGIALLSGIVIGFLLRK